MRKREVIRCLIRCSKYLMIKHKGPLIQGGMSSLCGDRWFTIITSLYGTTNITFNFFFLHVCLFNFIFILVIGVELLYFYLFIYFFVVNFVIH